jgi:ATP-dependent protease ClpP protease subunit
MNSSDFKNIVGEVKAGEIATIRFFGKITENSANQFTNEFDFLENCIRPKLIRVLINSEGGSVLHGMSVYSSIQNSTIETECIIEGMAASMASILWAAGTKSLMRDYSILMIHNPFLPDNEEAKASDLVQAFTKQIKTIYRKRFGLKKEHVESIMEGAVGKDGTFFDAGSAVKAGIIPSENVIHTSKQLCEKVKNELKSLNETTEIQDMMTRICAEVGHFDFENKHFSALPPNLKQIQKNDAKMTESNNNNHEYTAVAASLGFNDKYEVKDVMARVSELLSVEAKLKDATAKLTDAQTVIAGKDATIQNLQKENGELTGTLNVYKTKEAEEKKAKIAEMVEAAITAGKIDKSTKEQWISMAEANYDLAANTLNSIPAPEKISTEIASDPENVKVAKDTTKTVEQQLAEKVTAVVGEGFQFKKLN